MANPENLIPNENRTPIERRENARKAGIASGKARREKRDRHKRIQELFALAVKDPKLKAWKRLKDKGFRFTGWATNEGIRGVDFEVPDSFFSEHNHSCISDETREDLDLLFGGEE